MVELTNEDYDQMEFLEISRAEYEKRGLVGNFPKAVEVEEKPKAKPEPKKKAKK